MEGTELIALLFYRFVNAFLNDVQMIVASGTGTTAYFLANYFATHGTVSADKGVEVLAVPCVGSSDYLRKQMLVLDSLSGGNGILPTILAADKSPKRPFAKPSGEHLHLWKTSQSQTCIEFDLIYAPRTFEILLSQGDQQSVSLESFMPDANLIYYHCGGAEGNASQLDRYKRAGML